MMVPSQFGWQQAGRCRRKCYTNLGVANLDITFAGIKARGGFIVTSALNSEAILGLDFNKTLAVLTRKLHLKGRALHTRNPNQGVKDAKVVLQEQVVLPLHGMLEVMAKIEVSAVNCNCMHLVEDLSQFCCS